MSLADTSDPPPGAATSASAATQDIPPNHPDSTGPAEDSGSVAVGAATGTAVGQDWTALTPDELRAARLARFG